jgi:hypothetical protein
MLLPFVLVMLATLVQAFVVPDAAQINFQGEKRLI